MGAGHSKKRRKDEQKKRRSSSLSSLDNAGGSSLDSLRISQASPSHSPCLHHRSALSWSADHTLPRQCCPQLNSKQAQFGNSSLDAFGTSPNRLVPSYGSYRLSEISNQEYDELSTASLTRHLEGRSAFKPFGVVQSTSAEFSNLDSGRMRHGPINSKENVNPIRPSEKNQTSYARKGSTDSHQSASFSRVERSSSLNTQRVKPVMSSSLLSSQSFKSALGSGKNGEQKSKSSLMEDEEAIMSRWVHRKQMAQELRNLRMHLQNEDFLKNRASMSQCSDIDSTDTLTDSKRFEDYLKSTLSETSTTIPQKTSSTAGYIVQATTSQSSKSVTSTVQTFSSSENTTSSSSQNRRSIRSKFTRRHGNYRFLDNHPVMTRLQNEQNSRLELMERRMEEIRVSAMQEADRKKFAQIFPAKDDDSETQLMREARESLERMKEEKRKKALGQATETESPGQDNDSGEIIPVHVVSSREVTPVSVRSQRAEVITAKSEDGGSKKSQWMKGGWPEINLSHPLTWIWLPFLLFPLILRMLVSLISQPLPRNGNALRTGNDTADTTHGSLRRRKKSG